MDRRVITLKQIILKKIKDSPRGYATELAKIAGYTQAGGLTKVLENKDKEFDKFCSVLHLARHVFGDEEKKMMELYSTEIDPNNKIARHMLEYLSVNRLLDSMKLLIDKMLVCKNKESREWAKFYSISLEWQSDFYGIDFLDILNRLREFKTNIPELNTHINIMRCNSYYQNRMYRMSHELSHGIKKSLESIKDEYIKTSYSVRFYEIMSYLSLRVFNQPEQARIYAQSIIDYNVGVTFNAYANYVIGCSYLFIDYDKSKEHLTESVNIYTSINRIDGADNVREEVELLDIMWEKNIFSVYYNKEYKYYWYAKRNMEIKDLESLNLDEPFYLLIKGIRENNTDLLLHSLILFVKNGDLFLGNLSKLELLKRGYSEDIMKSLLSIYMS